MASESKGDAIGRMMLRVSVSDQRRFGAIQRRLDDAGRVGNYNRVFLARVALEAAARECSVVEAFDALTLQPDTAA